MTTDTLRARVENATLDPRSQPDWSALVTDLWAAYTARAQDASVAVARACLERDEARRSLAVAQADLAVARAVDAEHLQRAVRAEQERDAALAELTDFMRTVERRRFARQENARYCADRLSSMDADALRDLVAATASELDDAYAAFDQMAASSIRADLQRAEMRAERDAALAEVARLRGEAEAGVAKTLHGTVWGASMSSDSGDPDFDGLGYVEVYAPREDIAGVIVGRGSKAMVVIYEWREPVEVSDG